MLCLRSSKGFIWADISPYLSAVERMMSYRVKRKALPTTQQNLGWTPMKGISGEDSEAEFYNMNRAGIVQVGPSNNDETANMAINHVSEEPKFQWKEEIACMVQGGVPMGLRGELWQAFVGVRVRKVDGYYQRLLAPKMSCGDKELEVNGGLSTKPQTEKWKGQIEKDLPRTFPGHPALNEDGRNALRRLLTAYARHNPSVGYCQAMNFFGGLLLLLMPEENAFWTLLGIMDDYFEGYYSEEMIESQVDQLVLEDIIREKFPKLANHLDYLGVQVAWVTGPWFLSIFLNVIPWESVLRVWDVLLFDGNRVMLFHTAFALLELYGSTLVTTKDAGDAITLLQSLAGSTFDSSQLVLTACMGYQAVNEVKLQELREKYRPQVVRAMKERSRDLKDSKCLASQLYSFKYDLGSLPLEIKSTERSRDRHTVGNEPSNLERFCNGDAVLDLKEQVTWLKVELSRLLEEKRSASLRAEELETALMEMVKQDNRRLLSAKVEHLEKEVSELHQVLTDKQEQERAMIQVLMKMEKEQKVAEDARISAEQGAAAKKYAAHVLQEKYEEAMNELAQMEKRAVMAETLLEATVQYQSDQVKAQQQKPHSPRTPRTCEDSLARTGLLSRPFGLGWLHKNKGKPNDAEDSKELKLPNNGELNVSPSHEDAMATKFAGSTNSFS
ncbi:hypothetical protein M5K25_007096 [Dendrobium thyrsiflorum]|uniref:Rab-GAP TBC domain-containing protein n=1 Tax=Dendrobium thyrsiflorum TaxID=117978 RepID=A0ABD0VJX3_DENTH